MYGKRHRIICCFHFKGLFDKEMGGLSVVLMNARAFFFFFFLSSLNSMNAFEILDFLNSMPRHCDPRFVLWTKIILDTIFPSQAAITPLPMIVFCFIVLPWYSRGYPWKSHPYNVTDSHLSHSDLKSLLIQLPHDSQLKSCRFYWHRKLCKSYQTAERGWGAFGKLPEVRHPPA